MNVVIAAVLSLLFPGAGQAFNGQLGKGIGFGLFYLLAPIPLLYLMLHGQEWAMWTIPGVRFIVPLVSLVDAAGRAYEIRTGKRERGGGGWKPGVAVLVGGIALRYLLAMLTQSLVLSAVKTLSS